MREIVWIVPLTWGPCSLCGPPPGRGRRRRWRAGSGRGRTRSRACPRRLRHYIFWGGNWWVVRKCKITPSNWCCLWFFADKEFKCVERPKMSHHSFWKLIWFSNFLVHLLTSSRYSNKVSLPPFRFLLLLLPPSLLSLDLEKRKNA